LAARLNALAREQRRSKPALLREALEERLSGKRGCGSVRAIDLVKHLRGCLKGGPTDLATNPEQIRGFGGYPPDHRRYRAANHSGVTTHLVFPPCVI
jgi:hypothetical protein